MTQLDRSLLDIGQIWPREIAAGAALVVLLRWRPMLLPVDTARGDVDGTVARSVLPFSQ